MCVFVHYVDQFQRIGESVFNNSWSKVHDFDGSLGETNWSIIPEDSHPLISLPTEGEFSQVGVSLAAETSAVPVTVGMINRPDGDVRHLEIFVLLAELQPSTGKIFSPPPPPPLV